MQEREYEEGKKMISVAERALVRAKKIEAQKIKKGWRYVKVGINTQVLVPCDADGNPTEEGLKKLKSFCD